MNVIHWRSNIICALLGAESLAPVLQLGAWKPGQLLVSVCFNWFILCSPEQKWPGQPHTMGGCPWCHGEHCSSGAVGLILPQLSMKPKQSGAPEGQQAEPEPGQAALAVLLGGFLSYGCSSQLLVWLCWLVRGTGSVLAQFLLWMWTRNSSPDTQGTGSLVKSALRCRCQPPDKKVHVRPASNSSDQKASVAQSCQHWGTQMQSCVCLDLYSWWAGTLLFSNLLLLSSG